MIGRIILSWYYFSVYYLLGTRYPLATNPTHRRKTLSVFTALKSVVKRLPIIEEIVSERDKLRRECGFVPPGHFYSPVPSLEEIRRDEAKIFGSTSRNIPGLELHESEQLKLLEDFCQYYESMPFQPHKVEGLRYYFENPAYSYSDAIFLHCMIRHLGSGKLRGSHPWTQGKEDRDCWGPGQTSRWIRLSFLQGPRR